MTDHPMRTMMFGLTGAQNTWTTCPSARDSETLDTQRSSTSSDLRLRRRLKVATASSHASLSLNKSSHLPLANISNRLRNFSWPNPPMARARTTSTLTLSQRWLQKLPQPMLLSWLPCGDREDSKGTDFITVARLRRCIRHHNHPSVRTHF